MGIFRKSLGFWLVFAGTAVSLFIVAAVISSLRHNAPAATDEAFLRDLQVKLVESGRSEVHPLCTDFAWNAIHRQYDFATYQRRFPGTFDDYLRVIGNHMLTGMSREVARTTLPSGVQVFHYENGPSGATVAIDVQSGKHVVAYLSLGEIDSDAIETLRAGDESSAVGGRIENRN